MTDKAPSNHEVVYLLDIGDGWVWCSDPEPDDEDRRPTKYIREDVARDLYAPKLVEREAVERVAMAIAVEYYERDCSKDAKVSPYEDSGLFAAENWKEFVPEAKAALRAAGISFAEEP